MNNIYDCLNQFFSSEILPDDYKCEKCKKKSKASKKFILYRTPQILVLHLKRFKIFPRKKKISDTIKFPIQNLNIKK